MKKDISEIPFMKFQPRSFELWDKIWLLLTSGDFGKNDFNAMTVGWGGFGVMWNMPMVMVVVRPTRHTFKFINAYDTFSLCAFTQEYRTALNLLGSRSGRDGNKIKDSGLTPVASTIIEAPGYMEAELILECRKLYWEDLNPNHFLTEAIEKNYPAKDYHRMILGEIHVIRGDASKYSAS